MRFLFFFWWQCCIFFYTLRNFPNHGRIKGGLTSRAVEDRLAKFLNFALSLNVKELWYQGQFCMREKTKFGPKLH